MRSFPIGLLLLGTLPAFAARAGTPESPPKAEKAQPERVHLGAASVTVVDEHEPVDDVISRIRNGKTETSTTDKAKTAETHDQGSKTATATEPRRASGRSSLRAQRDRASARAEVDRTKDERRERAASTRMRLEQKQRR